jgi:nucleotide-binding universal stress UspA family protein
MFDVIVVGTDGSESAAVAVRHATELAKQTNAALHIVSAYRTVAPGMVGMASSAGAGAPDVEQLNRDVAEEGKRLCDDAAMQARREGVSVEIHAVRGDAADVLVSVATKVGGDLIVVGNRGMDGVRRFILGSVPNKVAHHCPCSLLIVDTTTS